MKTLWKNNLNGLVVLNIGRNEDCPCGSKIKFKYCCINKVDPPTLRTKGKQKIKRIERGVLL